MNIPAPTFNEKTAVHCTPYAFEDDKHPRNGRTVGYQQPGEETGTTDLFGINRAHIATVSADQAAALFVPPDPAKDAAARQRLYQAMTPAERDTYDQAEGAKRQAAKAAPAAKAAG
jgi:hypothetical protein